MPIRIQNPAGEVLCDFCSVVLPPENPGWDFPCTSFVVPGTHWGSDGDWGACDQCKDLVMAGDLEGVWVRNYTKNLKGIFPEEIIPLFKKDIMEMWKLFQKHWSGNVLPSVPGANPDDGSMLHYLPGEPMLPRHKDAIDRADRGDP